MLLQSTRNIKPTIGELKDGMLLVGDRIADGSADATWLWNGKFPTMILPEWDLKPLTPDTLIAGAVENKRISNPQLVIIRAMELRESLMGRMKLGGKTLIWLILGGVVIFYLLFGGGT